MCVLGGEADRGDEGGGGGGGGGRRLRGGKRLRGGGGGETVDPKCHFIPRQDNHQNIIVAHSY